MFKRNKGFIVIFSVFFIMGSCTLYAHEAYGMNKQTYNIIDGCYLEKNIRIIYPIITNYTDKIREKQVNTILKNAALTGMRYFPYAGNKLTLEINYEIKGHGENLFSVQFTGIGYVKGATHPNNLFYTINIDSAEGKTVKLKDIIIINREFIETLKGGKLKALNLKQGNPFEAFSIDELIQDFNEADSIENIGTEKQSDTFSYFKENSLGISVSVGHANGDHAEFEVNYRDIEKSINKKYKIILITG